jgi:peptide/nickel transport system ATP-binding protein
LVSEERIPDRDYAEHYGARPSGLGYHGGRLTRERVPELPEKRPPAEAVNPLEVRDLAVRYQGVHRGVPGDWAPAVEEIGLSVAPGEALGLLGESGSGKTTIALAIPGLLPANGRVVRGSVRLAGRELVGLSERELAGVRGAGIGLVAQEPALALNPVIRVGEQVAELVRVHRRMPWRRCREEAAQALAEMGFAEPGRIFTSYPHQLSGGERQRVTIARALVCQPPVVIADEPTASLDAAVAVEILALLRVLKARRRLALLLISHDPRVLAAIADRIVVMRAGRIVEQGPREEIFRRPRHSYTESLLRCLTPSLPALPAPLPAVEGEPDAVEPLLDARGLRKTYALRRPAGPRRPVAALAGVDLALGASARLALVGRSGSGKSTLVRCLALLEEPDGGEIRLGGQDVAALPRRRRAAVRPALQLVFQDPSAALNPRFSALDAVEEPMRLQKVGAGLRRRRALELMEQVGLPPALASRPVPRLSGGQKRRLLLARALATRPRVLLLDEPFTGLDLPLQAQIASLLLALQASHRFALVLVSHDLDVAAALAGEVAVLAGGRIVERAASVDLLRAPRHPASRELVDAARTLRGEIPGAVE